MKSEYQELLSLEWNEAERSMLERLIQHLQFYNLLIPKVLKTDIIESIKLCTELKKGQAHVKLSTESFPEFLDKCN